MDTPGRWAEQGHTTVPAESRDAEDIHDLTNAPSSRALSGYSALF